MKYCFHSTINKFLNTSMNDWLKIMTANYKSTSGFTSNSKYFYHQLDAWKNCYHSLSQTLKNFVIKNPEYGKLDIIFEYALAKVKNGKLEFKMPYRVDVVILSKTQATLLEYKSSSRVSSKEIDKDVKQLIKYIDVLTNNHIEARKMKVDGALLYSKVKNIDEYRNNYLVISTNLFGKKIVDLVNYKVSKHPDPDKWINSTYNI